MQAWFDEKVYNFFQTNKNKLLLIGLIFLAIISMCTSYVLFTNSNNLTNPEEKIVWGKHIDKNDLYEIQYPYGWNVYEHDEGHLSIEAPAPLSSVILLYVRKDNPSRLPTTDFLKLKNQHGPFEVFDTIDSVEMITSADNRTAHGVTLNFTKGIYSFRIVSTNVSEIDLRKIVRTLIVYPSPDTTINTPWPSIDAHLTEPQLSWQEGIGADTQFHLIAATLGYTAAPTGLLKFPTNEIYKEGEKIHAITLTLRIYQMRTGRVPLLLSRVVDESGIYARPNTTQFIFNGSGDNRANQYSTHVHNVIFVVPENEKEFLFKTGAVSNKHFILKLVDGNLVLEVPGNNG